MFAGVDGVLELLVSSGYDVNAQRPDGITALMIACRMVCSCPAYLLHVNTAEFNGIFMYTVSQKREHQTRGNNSVVC